MSIILQNAKDGKRRAGKWELIRYLQGGRLTPAQAIRAKCYDCCGMGEVSECGLNACSLFPRCPYRHAGKKTRKKRHDTPPAGKGGYKTL